MLDFEGILTAQAVGRRIGQEQAAAASWERRAEDLERELAVAHAVAAAADAGRLAHIRSLRTALDRVSPMDPVLRRTGRTFADGEEERVWQAGYGDAYDDVAIRRGVPRTVRAMTAGERLDAAEAEVLAEPVTVTRFLWWERVLWRGVEHRTAAGAVRARAEEANRARRAVTN